MNTLMQVTLFSKDFIELSKFYKTIFDLDENEELRSDVFRGYMAGECMVGFSALAAYEMLGLDPHQQGGGDQTALTFSIETKDKLDQAVSEATKQGATVIKDPFTTYYHWYLAVLRDPDGNAFRIACTNP
jgi:predicted enzyme related to lactoylglutathione lyase